MRLTALVLLIFASVPASAEDITVFAASSLKPALDTIASAWSESTGREVTLVYGGTPTLAKQVLAGAPADIFIAASADWMDHVVAAGAVQSNSRVNTAGNLLVLVGASGADTFVLEDLPAQLGDGRIAMGFVDAVPAGQYGKAAFLALGLWDDVAAHVVQTENVRVALAFVARGDVAYGVVYATDALAEPGVRVVARFPPDSHPHITYPAALTSIAQDGAADFLAALTAPAATAAFRAHGFTPP